MFEWRPGHFVRALQAILLGQGFFLLFLATQGQKVWLIGRNSVCNSSDWLKSEYVFWEKLLFWTGLSDHCVCYKVSDLFLFFPRWNDSVFLFHMILTPSNFLGQFSYLSPCFFFMVQVRNTSSFGGFVVVQTIISIEKYWLQKSLLQYWHDEYKVYKGCFTSTDSAAESNYSMKNI